MKSNRIIGSACVALLAAGCVSGPGQPWGVADLHLEAGFPIPADRRLADGSLLTAAGYGIALERVRLGIDGVDLGMAVTGGPSAFDPSDPPPGYSLCHNGHCHADGGGLPTYAEIAAKLLGTTGETPGVTLPIEQTVVLLSAPQPLPLAATACSDACVLPRGELQVLRIRTGVLYVEGQVRDVQGGPPRLPVAGLRLEVAVPVEVALGAPVQGAIDNGEPVGVRVRGRFLLGAALFDGVDFGSMPRTAHGIASLAPALADVRDRLRASSQFTATVERFDP